MEQTPTPTNNIPDPEQLPIPGLEPLEPEQTPPEGQAQNRFEGLDRAVEAIAVAYHGLRAALARRRMERAGGVMEKMDHKDALYADLGALATTGQRTVSRTATGKPAMPRTFAERWMDKHLDGLGYDKSWKDAKAFRDSGTFKLEGRRNKRERRQDKMGLKRRMGGIGAKQDGQLLAGERRILATQVDAGRLKLGEKQVKRTGNRARTAAERVNQAVDQPVLSRWRNGRRERAIGRIKTSHYAAERHAAKAAEIRARRQAGPDGEHPDAGNPGNPETGPITPTPENPLAVTLPFDNIEAPEPETPPSTPSPTPPSTPTPTSGPRVVTYKKGELFDTKTTEAKKPSGPDAYEKMWKEFANLPELGRGNNGRKSGNGDRTKEDKREQDRMAELMERLKELDPRERVLFSPADIRSMNARIGQLNKDEAHRIKDERNEGKEPGDEGYIYKLDKTEFSDISRDNREAEMEAHIKKIMGDERVSAEARELLRDFLFVTGEKPAGSGRR